MQSDICFRDLCHVFVKTKITKDTNFTLRMSLQHGHPILHGHTRYYHDLSEILFWSQQDLTKITQKPRSYKIVRSCKISDSMTKKVCKVKNLSGKHYCVLHNALCKLLACASLDHHWKVKPWP